jgi:ribonuclease BN (tRNA processing enzyme)
MKLIILGSGTCVPSLIRSAPAYYLCDMGKEVLVDCGSGTVLQLLKAGVGYKNIDAVFLTHTHPDHVAGLVPLLHALIATPLYSRDKELTLVGPHNFVKHYEDYIAPQFGRSGTSFVQVIEINDKIDYPPFHIFAIPTVHTENSIAFRFESKGRSIVFTGDADYDKGIIELSVNCDLLIADCAFPGSMKRQGHMTPRECGLVAQNASVKKLILSHLHALPVPDDDKLEECRAVFKGSVVLAEDLMEFNI